MTNTFTFSSGRGSEKHIIQQCPITAVSKLLGTGDWFSGRQFFHRQGVAGGMIQVVTWKDRERWEETDEALVAHLNAHLQLCQLGLRRVPGGWGPLY